MLIDKQGEQNDHDPAFTIIASTDKAPPRAFIVNTQTTIRTFTVRERAEPLYTLAASSGPNRHIAQTEGGRIVKMTIEALGRFQTVPHWYKGLTHKINGNGVPPLLSEGVMKTFLY